jgi:hypothetical protein
VNVSDAIEIPLEGDDPLVEPPIVDFFYPDPVRRAYVINFVPEDRVSRSQTEVAEVSESGLEGRRIALQLDRLASLLGLAVPIEKIVFGGGGEFDLHFEGKVSRSLPADSPNPHVTHEAYRCLQDIAMTAQVAYILGQRTPQPVA